MFFLPSAYGSENTCHGKIVAAAEQKAVFENKINSEDLFRYEINIRRMGNNLYVVKIIGNATFSYYVFSDYEEQSVEADCSISSVSATY